MREEFVCGFFEKCLDEEMLNWSLKERTLLHCRQIGPATIVKPFCNNRSANFQRYAAGIHKNLFPVIFEHVIPRERVN